MSGLLVLFYVAAVASLARWIFRASWTVTRKVTVLCILALAVPIAVLVLMADEGKEAMWWGVGLLLVIVVPANLLAIAIGGLWARLRGTRA